MAHYNKIKASKVSPVGTILPWTGTSSSSNTNLDGIPTGWIICNNTQKGLKAKEYPLLAQMIGNTYGPIPDPALGQVIGVNFGIVNSYPDYDDNDVFDLPDLNQRALIDVEADRVNADLTAQGATAQAKAEVLTYISRNGYEGEQPLNEYKSDVNIIFQVQASSEMSGRITGITMTPPAYYDTVYTVPRKLGQDHVPQHIHRAASEDSWDEIVGATSKGTPIMHFQPGGYQVEDAEWNTITPHGIYSYTSVPESWQIRDGQTQLTWYDPNDGGISAVETSSFKNIDASKHTVPEVQERQIPTFIRSPEVAYTDDGSGITVPGVQTSATTGPIPIPGQYRGLRNYHHSGDIAASRGGGQGYHTNQQTYDPDTFKVYGTTINHNEEEWASMSLRSHTHDAVEITMNQGSLGLPQTLLVNNVSTNTAAPVSVDTALNIAVNPNTASLTMIYIMRAY